MNDTEWPPINWARFVAAVLAGELLPIVALVVVVAVFGPPDGSEAEAFARAAGTWIGPSVGFAAILGLAVWAGSRSSHPVLQGLLIGITLASIDVAVLVAMGESFQWAFVASNVGRCVAGATGGVIAFSRYALSRPS